MVDKLIKSQVASSFRLFQSNNLLTSISVFVVFLSVTFAIYQQKKWQTDEGYVINDVRGYYAYLPYQFIYDDLSFQTAEKQEIWYSIRASDSTRFMKYTTGMAIAYAPGFFIAHGISLLIGLEANGYTLAYQISFIITALIFLLIALNYTKNILLLHFNDAVASTTILILFLGTNLFHYSTSYLSYAHLYSYTLIVSFLYYCIKWLRKPTIRISLLLGFLAGWFVLIRPIDLLLISFPLVYQTTSLSLLKQRFIFIGKNIRFLIPVFIGGLLVWIPQMLYIFATFGEIKLNTYSQEKFYFNSPHFYDSLFSFRDGWLIYSPLMVLSIVGLFFFCFKGKYYFYTALILIYWFVLASWWCWWYQGFGNRAFINLYPFLILPLAIGVKRLFNFYWTRVASKIIIVLGILLSLFQTSQFETGAYTPGQQTYAAYKENFLKKQASLYYFSLLQKPNMERAMEGKNDVYAFTFDTIWSQHNSNKLAFSSQGYFPLGKIEGKTSNSISVKIRTDKKVNEKDFLFIKSTNPNANITEFTRINNSIFGGSTLHYYCLIEEMKTTDTLELILSKSTAKPYQFEPFKIKGLNRSYGLLQNN